MKRTTLLHYAPSTILGYRKNGRPIYPIAGASPDGDGDGNGGDGGAGDGDGSGNGKPGTGDGGTGGEGGDKPDLEAEVAKWKALARKHEGNSKANAKAAEELAALKAANQTDAEKAIAEAEQRGRSAATAEVAQKLAAAEVRAALTSVVPDPAAVVEDLNLSKYVTDTGDVDQEAVKALREKYVALAAKPGAPDFKPGRQGGDRKDLNAQIAEAEKAGDTRTAIRLKTQALLDAGK